MKENDVSIEKTLQDRLEILEEENRSQKTQLEKITIEAYESGENLKGQVFIPEYLGFEETVINNAIGSISARIYTKKGYNIARPIDTSKDYWMILKPGEKEPICLNIKDMYCAIIILQACGMDISVKDYHEYAAKELAALEDVEDNMEEEMRKLAEEGYL